MVSSISDILGFSEGYLTAKLKSYQRRKAIFKSSPHDEYELEYKIHSSAFSSGAGVNALTGHKSPPHRKQEIG